MQRLLSVAAAARCAHGVVAPLRLRTSNTTLRKHDCKICPQPGFNGTKGCVRMAPHRLHRLLLRALLASFVSITPALAADVATDAGKGWSDDLQPITPAQWTRERAAHLLERAGFGGTPDEIDRAVALGARQAVARLVRPQRIANDRLAPFDPSGIPDNGIDPFPESRPVTTDLAKQSGVALGVDVKPAGNRPLQPVVNKFFFWLRASWLESNRIAYWWANRMLLTHRPLEEKMALYWHGHFATHEDKVRDQDRKSVV